jgi:hypothetical protein
MNHEHYLLCNAKGEVLRVYADWEVAWYDRKPGDYILTRKDPK